MDGATLAERFAGASARPEARQLGALPLVLPILEDLDLCGSVNRLCPGRAKVDLGRVAVVLALNRLLAPRPLSRLAGWAAETVVADTVGVAGAQLYDMRLGRALDALSPRLGPLWAELAARAIRREGVDLSVLHWDLTSCYFEGEHEGSELVRYGYSRDKRPDSKQVALGLDLSGREHLPVAYRVLPGNTADRTTPVANVEAVAAFLGRPDLAGLAMRPLIVSDCKMVTDAAVLACHRAGLGYLGPLPPGEERTAAILGGVSEAELAANALAYRPRRAAAGAPFVPYRGVWRAVTFEWEGQAVTDRALVVWSAAKARLDANKRRTLLKRLLDGLAHIQAQLNRRRYRRRAYVERRLARVRTGAAAGLVGVTLTGADGDLRLRFAIDRPKLAAAQARDGKYVLATNAAALSADGALAAFKGQDGVEKAFAQLKGPLRVRPFFVQTDARLQGLVFFNLLALLVRAILALRLRRAGSALSADRALAAFAPLQLIEVAFADGSRLRQVAELRAEQPATLRHLGIPSLERYQTGAREASR